MTRITMIRTALITLLSTTLLAGCEIGPKETKQSGYRGLAVEQISTPASLAAAEANNQVPAPQPPLPAVGPKARDVYQNVQVLGDLSVGEFTRLMTAMTEWIAPEEGCNYCHVNEGFHLDTLYTKKVARVMTAMTQQVNAEWGDHVKGTGVTCYTCHRGKHIPENLWAEDPGHPHAPGVATAMQNLGSKTTAYTSLPNDPFTPFLDDEAEIGVAGDSALQQGNRKSIKQTEWTYALMMHFSDSLGVNCTHCHNSRAFYSWEESNSQRVQAWHGIRMVRDLNNNFVDKTTDWLPDHRKGPLGDALKVNCATCHQGAYKPLLGVSMLSDYPNLGMQTNKGPEPAMQEVTAPTVEETEEAAADMTDEATAGKAAVGIQ